MPRKRLLTQFEKNGIIAILTAGCSRETAAKYAKCSTKKIRQTIADDVKFAADVAKAEEESEIFFINRIRKAADKEQYWRAAAWVLERRCPNRYAARGAGTLTMEQVRQIVSNLAEIVIQEIPQGTERRKILRRIHDLVKTRETEVDTIPLSSDDCND